MLFRSRVLQFAGDVLALALGVVEPGLQARRLAGLHPGLARVLIDEQERQRGDRVRRVAGRVDRGDTPGFDLNCRALLLSNSEKSIPAFQNTGNF